MNRTCPNREELHRYRTGKLTDDDAETIGTHLAVCTRCEQTLERLSDSSDSMIAAMVRDVAEDPVLHEPEMEAVLVAIQKIGVGRKETTDAAPSPEPTTQPTVDGYEILELIAAGGMGAVYKARDLRLDRVVAIKLPRPELVGDSRGSERFTREARAVATLRHPNICPIYEIGESQGRPFIAMGYVDGGTLKETRIDDTDRHQVAARTIATLARATDYAHRHGVIHRDIKPGNVLINSTDGEPVLTDFGLAKQADVPDMTHSREVLGTPAFMAPEQAASEGHKVGSASDVYSLGATLYFLLTKRPPFEGSSSIDTLRRVVEEVATPPRQVNRNIPKDLDTICLKCLEKEPLRRYRTASELADDLERYLRGEPIHARRVGIIERGLLWCRRNPALAVLWSTVATLLATATLVSTWSAIQLANARDDERTQRIAALAAQAAAEQYADDERRERERAELAEAESRQVSEFLQNVFQSTDALGIVGSRYVRSHQYGEPLSLEGVLDNASRTIDTNYKDDTTLKAMMLLAIGNAYRSIGSLKKARPLLTRARDINQLQLPEDDPRWATTLFYLGWLHHDESEFVTAENLYRQALELRRQQHGDKHLAVADVLFNLAWLLSDDKRDPEAEQLLREVISIRQRDLGPNDLRVVHAECALSIVLLDQGKDVASLLTSLSSVDLDVARGAFGYVRAYQLREQGKFEESRQAYEQALEFARRSLGERHPIAAMLLGDYAGLLRDMGETELAEEKLLEALAIGRVTIPTHPRMIDALYDYAEELEKHGRLSDAEAIAVEALEYSRMRKPPYREGELESLISRIRAASGNRPKRTE